MRALIPSLSSSLTPFLYRVTGLHTSKSVSTIVVVGGNGDYLDVADVVICMDSYEVSDVTVKARSVAKAFSSGHVQYAGRGLVHRLEWEEDEHCEEGGWVERERVYEGREVVVVKGRKGIGEAARRLLEKVDMCFGSDEIERGVIFACGKVLEKCGARGGGGSGVEGEEGKGKPRGTTYVQLVREVLESICWSGSISTNGGGVVEMSRPRAMEVCAALCRLGDGQVDFRWIEREERMVTEKDKEKERKKEADEELASLWAKRRGRK